MMGQPSIDLKMFSDSSNNVTPINKLKSIDTSNITVPEQFEAV
jgi:hypothetical protein